VTQTNLMESKMTPHNWGRLFITGVFLIAAIYSGRVAWSIPMNLRLEPASLDIIRTHCAIALATLLFICRTLYCYKKGQ
jgi:hypothetical protein